MATTKHYLALALFGVLHLPVPAAAYELGLAYNADSPRDAEANWNWSIRGSGLAFRSIESSQSLPSPAVMPIIVIEDACLPGDRRREINSWLREGGTLVLNGLTCFNSHDGLQVDEWRANMAGLSVTDNQIGLDGVYPRVTSSSSILSPFVRADGIRLDLEGINAPIRVETLSAEVLARGYRIEPGPGKWVRRSDAITISLNQVGEGSVLFLNFSLARIAACSPIHIDKTARNCRTAGTARALMRIVLANLLWEIHGIQIPLPWESPGNQPLGVILTGDVHADEQEYQVRSARLMAESLRALEAPLTYYVEGEVATKQRDHYQKLRELPNVRIGSHSAYGDKYDSETLSGMADIASDIELAERRLGIYEGEERSAPAKSIRTHGWASNETEAEAWSAMHSTGVSLVFDHNADAILPSTSTSAPSEWFTGTVAHRLFIPHFEKSIHTESDDFVLKEPLAGEIFSLASPEPDPCCNWAVTFDVYADYVIAWHSKLLQLGTVGGAAELWLWHPSTPVWKGGLEEIYSIVEDMILDERVELYFADEVATWLYNRERVQASPSWHDSGLINSVDLSYDVKELRAPPRAAREALHTLSAIGCSERLTWRTGTLSSGGIRKGGRSPF